MSQAARNRPTTETISDHDEYVMSGNKITFKKTILAIIHEPISS